MSNHRKQPGAQEAGRPLDGELSAGALDRDRRARYSGYSYTYRAQGFPTGPGRAPIDGA
ncbi:MAG: hypothetical protein RIB84_15815 [Sneathiellaceae bacterium]